VTEAGDGEDGRIKSAIGTGTLLDDGIGDTVRVSLTEDPVAEVPVCYALVKPYNDRLRQVSEPQQERIELRRRERPTCGVDLPEAHNPYEYARRSARVLDIGGIRIGGSYPPRVELAAHTPLTNIADLVSELEGLVRPVRHEHPPCEIIQLRVDTADDLDACRTVAQALRARGLTVPLAVKVSSTLPDLTQLLSDVPKLNVSPAPYANEAIWSEELSALIAAVKAAGGIVQWEVSPAGIPPYLLLPLAEGRGEGQDGGPRLEGLVDTALALAHLCQAQAFDAYLVAIEGAHTIPAYRLLAARLAAEGFETPLMLKTPRFAADDALLRASLTLGSLLCDGFGDAIEVMSDLPTADALRLSYNILQGARRRISKTEFISCPSCGRTQFDLETTTQRIKAKTGHLTGVKIAIMGCIVNGPGEMADADFGYVGAGPGKINLYVGKQCVERHIPFHLADQKLIELIKVHGKWIDPE
jgi:(E)-4-hydroxy-3-methylbut-2-enyl-diphosphate synthase